jgi:2-keto-4-pentenoate hydratase/2-oxohepta-3-ene-1,7-dioic acid hydratase in catechol pathway
VEAVAVGLDLTDRAAQSECREQQLPWAKGKCFTGSAVIGPFSDWTGDIHSLVDESEGLALILTVNGEVVQQASLSQMSITPSMQIDALQQWAPVCSGDYLFTGTPAGVGQLHVGDQLVAILQTIDGRSVSRFEANCV